MDKCSDEEILLSINLIIKKKSIDPEKNDFSFEMIKAELQVKHLFRQIFNFLLKSYMKFEIMLAKKNFLADYFWRKKIKKNSQKTFDKGDLNLLLENITCIDIKVKIYKLPLIIIKTPNLVN